MILAQKTKLCYHNVCENKTRTVGYWNTISDAVSQTSLFRGWKEIGDDCTQATGRPRRVKRVENFLLIIFQCSVKTHSTGTALCSCYYSSWELSQTKQAQNNQFHSVFCTFTTCTRLGNHTTTRFYYQVTKLGKITQKASKSILKLTRFVKI